MPRTGMGKCGAITDNQSERVPKDEPNAFSAC